MNYRQIPNILTVLRLILIVPFWYFLSTGRINAALWTYVVASCSDAIDGFIARHWQCTSLIGAFLDPLADKLLITMAFVGLTELGAIPLWLCLLVVARDVVILIGVGSVKYWKGEIELAPRLLSKINTIIQMVFLAAILFILKGWIDWPMLKNILIVAVVITTVASWVDYICVGMFKLCDSK